jgi:hypothetical protein
MHDDDDEQCDDDDDAHVQLHEQLDKASARMRDGFRRASQSDAATSRLAAAITSLAAEGWTRGEIAAWLHAQALMYECGIDPCGLRGLFIIEAARQGVPRDAIGAAVREHFGQEREPRKLIDEARRDLVERTRNAVTVEGAMSADGVLLLGDLCASNARVSQTRRAAARSLLHERRDREASEMGSDGICVRSDLGRPA